MRPLHDSSTSRGFALAGATKRILMATKWQFLPLLGRVLDGRSPSVLAGGTRPTMREADAEAVVQKTGEAHPEAPPRIISDQGTQFKSRE
jgi:hypothetical protein